MGPGPEVDVDSRAALQLWLVLQSLTMGGFAALFGLLFPVGGLVLALVGVAPNGEDPLGPALAMGCAGPMTAVLYLPGAVAPLWALRRLRVDPEHALVPVVLAIVAGTLLCGAMSAVPLVLAVLALAPESRS